jgi:aspartate/methionine/tyrosine aminotransferase
MTFDETFGKPLPKMAFIEGMYDRTVSVYSAGKIFAATGVRSGWVIGPAHLIKAVRSVHQYTVFCSYNVIENTVAKSLQVISRPEDTYMKDYATKLTKHRDILLEELINCKYDFDLWIPKGGYFVLADISRVNVMEKYMKDDEGNPRTKDYAFCIQLAYENGVVAIPCSPFYSK